MMPPPAPDDVVEEAVVGVMGDDATVAVLAGAVTATALPEATDDAAAGDDEAEAGTLVDECCPDVEALQPATRLRHAATVANAATTRPPLFRTILHASP
jgi:hypothetical protein